MASSVHFCLSSFSCLYSSLSNPLLFSEIKKTKSISEKTLKFADIYFRFQKYCLLYVRNSSSLSLPTCHPWLFFFVPFLPLHPHHYHDHLCQYWTLLRNRTLLQPHCHCYRQQSLHLKCFILNLLNFLKTFCNILNFLKNFLQHFPLNTRKLY